MLSCHNATQLLSESQEKKLKLGERMSLRLHLLICSGCRNFGNQMHSLRKIARIYASGKTDHDRSEP
jgi:hypothetical protein